MVFAQAVAVGFVKDICVRADRGDLGACDYCFGRIGDAPCERGIDRLGAKNRRKRNNKKQEGKRKSATHNFLPCGGQESSRLLPRSPFSQAAPNQVQRAGMDRANFLITVTSKGGAG